MRYLIAHGIARDRLEAQGYGESQPLYLATDPQAWRNRRIELIRLE